MDVGGGEEDGGDGTVVISICVVLVVEVLIVFILSTMLIFLSLSDKFTLIFKVSSSSILD